MKLFFLSLWGFLILSACSTKQTNYTELDLAVSKRDFTKLIELTNSRDKNISDQAYRALYNTSGNVDVLLNRVLNNPSKLGFFSLRGQPLKDAHLASIIADYPQMNPVYKPDVIITLGEKADWTTHLWLLENWVKSSDPEQEKAFAYAISRSSLTYEIPDSLLKTWVQKTTAVVNNLLITNYLYGAYRSRKIIYKPEYSAQLFHFLETNYEQLSTLNKQYLIQILSKVQSQELLTWMNDLNFPSLEVNVQVEMIRALGRYVESEEYAQLCVSFLSTRNNLALQTYFETLAPKLNGETFKKSIKDVQDYYEDEYHPIRLSARLYDASASKSFTSNDLKTVLISKPYSLNQALKLAENSLTADKILLVISDNWDSVAIASKLSAAEYAVSLIGELSQKNQKTYYPFLRKLLSSKDRGILIGSVSILESEALRNAISMDEFVTHLLNLDIEQDIEVFQTYIPIFKKLGGESSTNFFAELSKSSNPTLQKALVSVDITPEVEASSVLLAIPNRSRLSDLGAHPILTLLTNKGEITIELDAERNPTTVWLIDSLSNSGKFDNVPFHRVIGNFVMQGGDFETRNGYGGGSTIIPTEGSDLEFERGTIGMASAGTDTESAQYFIMHQWHPHLNGRYTRFGKVLSGLEVVDQIIVGDMVLKAGVHPKQ